MTYSRSKKVTDQERKLESLKVQLYGKDGGVNIQFKTPLPESSQTTVAQITSTGEDTYLKKDLTKIMLLGSLAIGVQFVLYFALQRGLIGL